MSLLQATLKTELLKLFDETVPGFVGFPPLPTGAANNWAAAYKTYAIAAQDRSGAPVLTYNEAGFASTLLSNLPPPLTGTAAQSALAFDLAFVAFWTGATFNVSPPYTAGPPSVPPCLNVPPAVFLLKSTSVVTVAAPGVLQPLLLSIFSDSSSAAAQIAATKADQIATAFHTATTTAVQVTIAGTYATPGGPQPIANICTVF